MLQDAGAAVQRAAAKALEEAGVEVQAGKLWRCGCIGGDVLAGMY